MLGLHWQSALRCRCQRPARFLPPLRHLERRVGGEETPWLWLCVVRRSARRGLIPLLHCFCLESSLRIIFLCRVLIFASKRSAKVCGLGWKDLACLVCYISMQHSAACIRHYARHAPAAGPGPARQANPTFSCTRHSRSPCFTDYMHRLHGAPSSYHHVSVQKRRFLIHLRLLLLASTAVSSARPRVTRR